MMQLNKETERQVAVAAEFIEMVEKYCIEKLDAEEVSWEGCLFYRNVIVKKNNNQKYKI